MTDNDSRNLIHASDSFDSASKEIELWFAQAELAEYKVSSLLQRRERLVLQNKKLTPTADHLGTSR
jgi:hypothetical protein